MKTEMTVVSARSHNVLLLYLEVGEVFSHEPVDLTNRETPCLTVPQSHEDQDAMDRRQAL